MGKMEEYKPVMAMTIIQLSYAGVTVFARATLVHGLSPRVFIFCRQAFATSVPNRNHYNQSNLYLEGLYLTSSSMGSVVGNIIPAITFLISFLTGYEKMNFRDIRGLAKIAGTILYVAGAISMTLLRGPKVLNSESALPITKSVPISAHYPDNLSLAAWMCLFGTIQCAVVTFFQEKDPNAWNLYSYYEFATCLYAGIGASALSFTVLAWAISKRGHVFSAMFNPLCTVIVTNLAALFFQEEIYTGSVLR